MMKACIQRAFAMLSHEKQADFRNRYGQWYESHGQFLQALDACPTEILKNRPLALLVLMCRMFTWYQIPKMQEL